MCKEEGLVVKVGKGNTRVYKYSEQLVLRNHEECYALGRKALLEEKVYVPSIIFTLDVYNVIVNI